MKRLILFLTKSFTKSELAYQSRSHFDHETYKKMEAEVVKTFAENQEMFMCDLLKWYEGLTPAQKCTVHSPSGSGTVLYNLNHKQLVEKFLEYYTKSPKEKEAEQEGI